MFRCPDCHGHFIDLRELATTAACPACGAETRVVDGIPLLVRDLQAVERLISKAREDGREAWFRDPQIGQWTGPYRHHVRKRKEWVEQALFRYLGGDTDRIGLDLGCGDGSNLSWLRPHFTELFASDYNLARLIRASRLDVDAGLFMADVTDYPTDNDSFDVIYFNHVLEHIPDDVAALREVHRILRPGGLVVLGVPNEGAAFWQLAYRLQPRVRATSDHLHHYTAETIAARCFAAGFAIREVHPIGWGVPHWTLDAAIRRFRWVDDGLEAIGRRFLSSQATSLYLLLGK